ncbi:hypothetical protein STEG23_032969 [Scotinomys teguina]
MDSKQTSKYKLSDALNKDGYCKRLRSASFLDSILSGSTTILDRPTQNTTPTDIGDGRYTVERDMEGFCDNPDPLPQRNSLDRKLPKRTFEKCSEDAEEQLSTIDGFRRRGGREGTRLYLSDQDVALSYCSST